MRSRFYFSKESGSSPEISSTFLTSTEKRKENKKNNMLADLSNISAESRVKSFRGVFLKVGPVVVNVV